MSTASASVPAEADLLCEGCGYTLTGLTAGSNCPECGKPIAESDPVLRVPPAWESVGGFEAFWATTRAIIAHPGLFYRSLPTRGDERKSSQFAQIHMALAGTLFGICAILHVQWVYNLNPSNVPGFAHLRAHDFYRSLFLTVLGAGAGYLTMLGIAWLAARLTSLEARFWGLRLPLPTVRRVMNYHAAHYLPVSIITLTMVGGITLLRARGVIGYASDVPYLYALCGVVVVGAVYLFRTYWIGMLKLMYANR